MPAPKPSLGVVLFGIGLLLSALYKIFLLTFFSSHFAYLFNYLPQDQFQLRYLLSWAEKILEVIAAVGILCLNDWCRKIAILIWLVILCTLSIKHPVLGFQNHVQYLIDQGILNMKWLHHNTGITQQQLVGMSVWGARLQDAVFGLCLIYFFTRDRVKKQFKA